MSKEFHSTSMDNNTNKTACPFCDQMFLSSITMSEHLTICGSKTDQCPVCHRFIRRAVFAYHFENKCADLEDGTKSNSFDTRQTKTSNIIKCEFCRADCHQEDYDRHKERCINRRKDIDNSNQNRSFVHQHRNDTDVVYIPCELCQTQIELSNFANHQKNCKTQPKIREQQNQHANQNVTEQHQCVYCEKQYNNKKDYYTHLKDCPKNPARRSYAEAVIGHQ